MKPKTLPSEIRCSFNRSTAGQMEKWRNGEMKGSRASCHQHSYVEVFGMALIPACDPNRGKVRQGRGSFLRTVAFKPGRSMFRVWVSEINLVHICHICCSIPNTSGSGNFCGSRSGRQVQSKHVQTHLQNAESRGGLP